MKGTTLHSRKRSIVTRHFLFALLGASLAACEGTTTVSPSVATVELGMSRSTLATGDTMIVRATVLSADGQVLSGRRLSWTSSNSSVATVGAGPGETQATVTARWPGQARITVECEGASRAVTVEVSNVPPVARIESPTTGASFTEGQTIAFRGSGTDVEDDTLQGDELVWTSNNDGQIGTAQAFDRDDLSLGTHTIILTVTDSHGATDLASVAITVLPNQPPTASISSPADGATFAEGDPVSFQGSGSDPEDGTLTGSALVWTSDLDGQLDTGQSFQRSDLSTGTHTIVLAATDSQGDTGRDTVSITVAANQVPTASISSPTDGADFAEGETVNFQGSGSDPEDGTLTGSALVWTSDLDGQLDTGQSFQRSDLSTGTHTIVLAATDSQGDTGRDTVSITVAANQVPTASISSPTDGADFAEGETVNFQGSGSDPEDGTLTGDALVWTSDLDGELGIGESFERSDLSVGTHTIVLAATDSQGDTGHDTVSITVSENEAPTASISSPPDGAVYTEGNTVSFQGSGSDPEDGTLTDDALVWTSDRDGQLGIGESLQRNDLSAGAHKIVLTVTDTRGATGKDRVSISVRLSFDAVSAGWYHTCGLKSDGAAYCWGNNDYGQLGDGSTSHRKTPTPVSDGLSFDVLSAGRYHTCGLTTGGTAYCWGDNTYGQLGDGSTSHRKTPTPVSDGLSFDALSAGWYHTCGLTGDGTAYCWGNNFSGQLGDGTTDDRLTPTQVDGGLSFTALDAGRYHTCAIQGNGNAYCWGNNSYGQLGDSTTIQRETPTAVKGELIFDAVSAGRYHTCGVTSNATAYCWGYNAYGQLGDGTTIDRWTPTAVSNGLSFAAVSAGSYHTCGPAIDGTAYCWGDNDYGQLGDGTTAHRKTPTAVDGGFNFDKLTTGRYHTCAVTGDGTAHCWGSNSDGQLGDGTTNGRLTPVPVSPPE